MPVLAVAVALLSFPALTHAQEMRFSQSILPVRFVYLDGRGEIERIWSNVSAKDDLYVIKFFAFSRREIKPTSENVGGYRKIIQSANVGFTEANIFERGKFFEDNRGVVAPEVEFVQKDASIEEIHTYV